MKRLTVAEMKRRFTFRAAETHHGCLQMASKVLNLYQDIEDILVPLLDGENDYDLRTLIELKRIKELNEKIGKAVAKYLPE